MHFTKKAALAIAMSLTSVTANMNINNWCNTDVFVATSHNGGCDAGPDGTCLNAGGQPLKIPAGNGGNSIGTINAIADGAGTSIKVSRDAGMGQILQLEYAVTPGGGSPGVYWDLSNLDGAGSGLVGTPFANDNVKLSPTGNGVGTGTCVAVKCPAGQLCVDAYQHPDDNNTRWCPVDTGDMWLDLCEPTANFNSKKRAVGFRA